MSNRRVLILVVAVAMAGLTAFATLNYVNAADERALGGAELVEVFIVKQDIAKGFPGAKALDEGFITKENIPRKFYPARAVVDIQSLRDKVALAPLVAGVPVVDGNFVEPAMANESFAQRIPKGMEAVTLSISDVQGVARLVVPGDKVNMLITMASLDPAAGSQTQYVLQGIEVLAIGAATELQPGEAAPLAQTQAGVAQTVQSGLMTFSVPAVDAERLVHASKSGDVHLTLVPPDFKPAPVPPVNNANLFS